MERKLLVVEFNLEKSSLIIQEILKINEYDDEQEKMFKDYIRKPIELLINSYGGSVYACLGIINVIKTSKTPIHTICLGAAMSCGFMLLISGHKRFMYEHSIAMYHQISSVAWGEVEAMKNDLIQTEHLQTLFENIVLNRTKINKQMLSDFRLKKFDKFFTSKECLQFGIVDNLKI